tara:strand:+ start:2351 stop:2629 length:279 start_codon:yes stop_codon:yes gene_type:complete
MLKIIFFLLIVGISALVVTKVLLAIPKIKHYLCNNLEVTGFSELLTIVSTVFMFSFGLVMHKLDMEGNYYESAIYKVDHIENTLIDYAKGLL